MSPNISTPASVFEKVLAAYETGGITYTDVLAQLRRLLATDAPPAELLEILRRRELIEPLPQSAHSQVVGLLNAALERTDPVQAEAVPPVAEPSQEPAPAQEPPQEAPRAAPVMQVPAADLAVARAALEEALRKLDRYQVEFRTLREAVAAREAELRDVRARVAIVEAELSAARNALQSEQVRARAAAVASAEGAASTETELRSLREVHARAAALESELAIAQAALEAERTRARAADKRLRELEHFQIELRTVRAAHSALEEEHATALSSLAARATENSQLAANLEVARAQLEAVSREVKSGRDAAESQLDAARAELAAMKTQAGSYLEALRNREWRSGADLNATPATTAPVEIGSLRRSNFGAVMRNWSRSVQRLVLKPGETRRAIGLTVAIGGVALVVWYLFHLASVPAQAPGDVVSTPSAPGAVIRDCATCPALTVLPTGRFKQGSARGDGGGAASDKPLHWVLIGRPLAMSTSSVTVDQFRPFAAATGRDMQGCESYDGEWQRVVNNSWSNPGFEQTGSHPVTCASWNDAQAYAQWLSATTGHRYRLPSASEWEYAARGGTEASQPWSADGTDACTNANVADKSAARRYPGWTTFACEDGFVNTAPVGSFKSNAFGLNDMLGNVFQWTEDCWHADYNGTPIDGSARTDGDCSQHELRGGSWFSSPAYVRANYRNHFGIDYRASSIGIRLVRELD